MRLLKQSTATTRRFGPFLDETDGKTAEVGLTITQADILISKAGGAYAQKNEASAASHDTGGMYSVTFNTTDTGTLGTFEYLIHESGALPVFGEFMVVPANVYDSLVAGSDKLQTDAVEISSSEAAANSVEANIGNLDHAVSTVDTVVDGIKDVTDNLPDSGALTTISGKIDTVDGIVDDLKAALILVDTTIDSDGRSTTTARLTAGSDQDDVYNGMWVILDSDEGNGAFIARHITDYDGDDKELTFTPALINDADEGGQIYIVPGPGYLTTIAAAIKAVTDNLPNSGALSDLAAILTDTGTTIPGLIAALNDPSLAEIVAGVWDEDVDSTHQTPGSAGKKLDDAGSGASAGDIADAVWDEPISAHVLGDTYGEQCGVDVDAILADTAEMQADDVPALIAGLNDPTVGQIADQVWEEDITGHTTGDSAGEALGDAGSGANAAAIADQVWDEVLSGHVDGGSTGEALGNATGDTKLRSGTAQDGADGSITLDASASAVDEYYTNSIVAIDGGTGIGQSRVISGYTGSTKVATVQNNWGTNPDNTSTFAVLPLGEVTAKDVSTILSRLGSWTGTGVNTILGAFKAICSKAASAPSDIGGTFVPADDSVERIKEKVDELGGTGFNSATHSLKKLGKAVGNTNKSGSYSPSSHTLVSATPRAGGYLQRMYRAIRRATREPSTDPTYTTDDLLEMMATAWQTIWTELSAVSDEPITVRFDIDIEANVQEYFLPPNIQGITRISKVETTTGLVIAELKRRSDLNPWGPGYSIEGNILRVTPLWKTGETMRLEFVPNGEIYPHEGTCRVTGQDDTANTTTLQIRLYERVSTFSGLWDKRPSAYAGYWLRLISEHGYVVDERVIRSFDRDLYSVVVSPQLSGTLYEVAQRYRIMYEVVPVHTLSLENLIVKRVARDILGQEGNKNKYALVTQNHREDLRAARMKIASTVTREASQVKGDTVDNDMYLRGRMGGIVT